MVGSNFCDAAACGVQRVESTCESDKMRFSSRTTRVSDVNHVIDDRFEGERICACSEKDISISSGHKLGIDFEVDKFYILYDIFYHVPLCVSPSRVYDVHLHDSMQASKESHPDCTSHKYSV